MLAVVVVTFIAGYSIVSFVVRKWKEGPGNPSLKQGRPGSNSTSEDASKETGDAYQPSHKEDQG
jgi:hypothetical protein